MYEEVTGTQRRSARKDLRAAARAIGRAPRQQTPHIPPAVSPLSQKAQKQVNDTELGNAIRHRVYRVVKFAKSLQDQMFGGRFCKQVFDAIQQPMNENLWYKKGGYLPKSLTELSHRRTTHNTGIKDAFQGMYMDEGW
jgi:hypothetical protein